MVKDVSSCLLGHIAAKFTHSFEQMEKEDQRTLTSVGRF